jgi:HlyD family secretion protein
MDVPRGKEVARRRQIKRIALIAVGVLALGGVTVAVARLKPAAPSVDLAEQYVGTVKRGEMERQVRGPGRLTPLAIYWLSAPVEGRVTEVVRRPGLEPVKANDVILVLANPEISLDAEKAEWQVKQDEATLANLKVKLESEKLDQKASLAELESQYTRSKLQADRDLELTRLNLKSDLESRLSVNDAQQLQARVALQKQRLGIADQSIQAQIEAEEVALASSKANYETKRKQVEQLTIRAPIDGLLQELDVEVGQRVAASVTLAKVADPKKLKAELKIAETQMKDVRIGLDSVIDTRNGLIPGRVIRIDPAAQNGTVTIDVGLLGALPLDARPELSVDGTIEIEKLASVVFVDRPVSGEPNSTIGLFKIDSDGRGAERVNVKLGRASVNTIEVLNGLQVGDKVILSDMSRFDANSRLRLN